MAGTLTMTKINGLELKKIASGKVRELFELNPDTLLFLATDRISAFDVVMENGIPQKGAILTQLSAHWFNLLSASLPKGFRHHLISLGGPFGDHDDDLNSRSMQVRRLPLIPLESIVRGYITGSAWIEYKSKGTVHGFEMPKGLVESQKLESPMWTPSTKAEPGEHDENISPSRAAELVGAEIAKKVEEMSLKIYVSARDYAEQRGIIIADTKFEFGLDPETKELVLVDEVLTPDSSRFWPAETYEVGRSQESYDKQYLRDWLILEGLKGKANVVMPPEVVLETSKKYREAFMKLTGKPWIDVPRSR